MSRFGCINFPLIVDDFKQTFGQIFGFVLWSAESHDDDVVKFVKFESERVRP